MPLGIKRVVFHGAIKSIPESAASFSPSKTSLGDMAPPGGQGRDDNTRGEGLLCTCQTLLVCHHREKAARVLPAAPPGSSLRSQVPPGRALHPPAPPPLPRRRHRGLGERSDIGPWNHGVQSDTVKLNGAHKARTMFSGGGAGGKGLHASRRQGSRASIAPSSRWVGGRRHLCCTCTCSKARTGWPGAGTARPPGAGAQIQQRCPRPARRKHGSRG